MAGVHVPLVDDDKITKVYRYLFLDIEPNPGYRRGGIRRASILIGDNDNYWTGQLAQGSTQRSFRLEILRSGKTTDAWLVAGGGHDGLPNTTDSSVSTSIGVVPEGRWKADSISMALDSFGLTTPTLAFSTASRGRFLQRAIRPSVTHVSTSTLAEVELHDVTQPH